MRTSRRSFPSKPKRRNLFFILLNTHEDYFKSIRQIRELFALALDNMLALFYNLHEPIIKKYEWNVAKDEVISVESLFVCLVFS